MEIQKKKSGQAIKVMYPQFVQTEIYIDCH